MPWCREGGPKPRRDPDQVSAGDPRPSPYPACCPVPLIGSLCRKPKDEGQQTAREPTATHPWAPSPKG